MKQIDFLIYRFFILITLISLSGCDHDTPPKPIPVPGEDIIQLPVVVHVLHQGQSVGEGPNLTKERIDRQIEILNEDFRKKKGTRGFNEHPDGGDTMIEFVLARQDSEGNLTSGIHRVNIKDQVVIDLGYNQNHYAQYAYWPPDHYINIWTTPLPDEAQCLILGQATGPKTDLPGTEWLAIPGDGDAEGILINWPHFGESDLPCHSRLGRTLTHEMGHYLGLLHTWGDKKCPTNDHCEDTPAVTAAVFGNVPYEGCDGEQIMIGNYMNYSDDEVMNIFTHDQIERMHYVLEHHVGRKTLITSPGLQHPE